MIRTFKHTELSDEIRGKINSCIHDEFGHIPIVAETEWANPDWTIVYYEGSEIAMFYNIVEREVDIDGKAYKAGGVNNVITPKAFRGKGHASKVLKSTAQFLFNDLSCDMGLLLCADNLIPFYKRLNWYTVDCPVYFSQSSGRKLWTANTMLLSKTEKLVPREIDLKGLPW